MYRERIHSTPIWRGAAPRYDTVYVETNPELPGMRGMTVGRVFLFFSFTFQDVYYPCALVHWYSTVGSEPDEDTGLWVVKPDQWPPEDGYCPSRLHCSRCAHYWNLWVFFPSGRISFFSFFRRISGIFCELFCRPSHTRVSHYLVQIEFISLSSPCIFSPTDDLINLNKLAKHRNEESSTSMPSKLYILLL